MGFRCCEATELFLCPAGAARRAGSLGCGSRGAHSISSVSSAFMLLLFICVLNVML